MLITETEVPGTYRLVPESIGDSRGSFYEAAKHSDLTATTGLEFTVRQVNHSVSHRGVLRGLHCLDVPPDASKLVTCVRGAVLDIMVDLRVGSPTFGRHAVTRLSGESGVSVYLPGSIGHAFLALTDDTCMAYLLSHEYVPGSMVDIDPLDPELDLPWELSEPPILSAKDTGAPSLARVLASGRLPTFEPRGRIPAPREELRRT